MSEFLNQGGYGFYVWCSYGAAALLMAAEVVTLLRGRKGQLARIRRLLRMNAAEANR